MQFASITDDESGVDYHDFSQNNVTFDLIAASSALSRTASKPSSLQDFFANLIFCYAGSSYPKHHRWNLTSSEPLLTEYRATW